MSSKLYTLQNGPVKLAVDANFGAHIVEFSLDGKNALALDRPEIGSTFWPSPERFWGWPPPKALDKAPYRVEAQADELLLTSEVCEQTHLVVHKQFKLHALGMTACYTMENRSQEAQRFAPWEITRIYGGTTFYQSDEAPLAKSSGCYTQANGCIWHEYDVAAQKSENQKLFGFGSAGWVANAHNGLLLVKSFKPLSAKNAAPEEAEIEIYSHGDADLAYIEMEQQGPYKKIQAGEQLSWMVNWLIAKLPEGIDTSAGSEALKDAVLELFELASRQDI